MLWCCYLVFRWCPNFSLWLNTWDISWNFSPYILSLNNSSPATTCVLRTCRLFHWRSLYVATSIASRHRGDRSSELNTVVTSRGSWSSRTWSSHNHVIVSQKFKSQIFLYFIFPSSHDNCFILRTHSTQSRQHYGGWGRQLRQGSDTVDTNRSFTLSSKQNVTGSDPTDIPVEVLLDFGRWRVRHRWKSLSDMHCFLTVASHLIAPSVCVFHNGTGLWHNRHGSRFIKLNTQHVPFRQNGTRRGKGLEPVWDD